MGVDILALNSPSARHVSLVGGKAAKLAFLLQEGLPVPPGFCVTTQAFRRFPEALDDEVFRKRLSKSLNGLLQAEGNHRFVIVRSSANLEDSFQAAFPGVFSSSGPLNSFGSLITALEQCFLAIQNDQVKKYCQHKGIKAKGIRISALVQQYIEPDYSGVAILQIPHAKLRGAYVEMTTGASNKILRGTENAMAFLVRRRKPEIVRLTRATTGNSRIEYSIVRKVVGLLHVLNNLNQGEVIEWVAKDGRIFLVQSRPLLEGERIARRVQRKNRLVATPSRHKKKSILTAADRIGLKAAAMQLFVQLGWFTKGFVLFPPHTGFDQIRQTIRHTNFGNNGLTVRFSRGGEIGLPRFFVQNKTEALRIIRKHADSAWAVIIHDHINVKNSFEVFIGTDRAVLEHMPGMWESNTRNAPDVIIAEGDAWFALRVSDDRRATFEGPRGMIQTSVAPPTEADLYLWADTLKQYIPTIRARFWNSLPLIFHCVSEGGPWQFLNIRTTERGCKKFCVNGH